MNGLIIRLSVVDSTNIYTSKLLSQSGIKPWTVVVADSQKSGKGQRGNSWESEFGKNLLCSIALFPEDLKVLEQFKISMAASLAVCDALADYGIEANVKWPNDILVGGRKVAGILIENQIINERISSSVVGIGLNVNQQSFSPYPWPATSMKQQLKSQDIDVEGLLGCLILHMRNLMDEAAHNKVALINKYNQLLAHRGREISFSDGRKTLVGWCKGVTLLGEIVIDVDGKEMSYVNGEIKLNRTLL